MVKDTHGGTSLVVELLRLWASKAGAWVWSLFREHRLWLCGSQQAGKFFKRWEYQTPWPASREICMQVKKQQLEPEIEQRTGSKSGKQYVKAVYCHLAYLTYMQSTSWEMPGSMKHKLE